MATAEVSAGNDCDRTALQRLVESRGFDRFDPGVAMDSGGPHQLPAHEAAGLYPHVLEGHGEETRRDLLARCDDDVIFLGIAERRCLAA
jgi:hypothetical protein